MSKSIKINEYLELQKDKQRSLKTSKSLSFKNAVKLIGVVTSIIIAVTILTLAYNYEAIYFKNIIIGFFIIGLTLFIKAISDQKTTISRVKK